MAITKPLVTTTVTVLHQQEPFVFADAVGQDGKVTRDGTNARYQILHGDTVAGNAVIGGGSTTYTEIPFHAVVRAIVTKSTSDPIDEPSDAFCVSENDTSDEGGSDEGGSGEGGGTQQQS